MKVARSNQLFGALYDKFERCGAIRYGNARNDMHAVLPIRQIACSLGGVMLQFKHC